jgi:flagellin-like protein
MFKRKGISPLIASVLLVAFTMAIAGIMAAWATSFTNSRLQESNCYMTVTITDLTFTNTTVVARITNQNSQMNLSGLRGNLEYNDPTKERLNIVLKDYGAIDPLPPATMSTVIINTNFTESPRKMSIVASSCPKLTASQTF